MVRVWAVRPLIVEIILLYFLPGLSEPERFLEFMLPVKVYGGLKVPSCLIAE